MASTPFRPFKKTEKRKKKQKDSTFGWRDRVGDFWPRLFALHLSKKSPKNILKDQKPS